MKTELYLVIFDLRALGCTMADIASWTGLSKQRVQQIVADMGMKPNHPRFDDLPDDMQQRIRDLTLSSDSS